MRKIALLCIMAVLASCSQKGSSVRSLKKGLSPDSDIGLQVSQDSEDRVVSVDQALSITPPVEGEVPLVYTSNLLEFNHKKTILAPRVSSIDQRRLRATSVYKVGSKLYVSYLMEGPEFLGALDIIDVADLNAPVVLSSYRFQNVEVADVKVKGTVAYLVGAKKEAGATMLALNVANPLSPSLIKYTVFPGDIATSLDIRQNVLIASSSLDGGLATFNLEGQTSYQYIKFDYVDNALYVKNMLKDQNDSSIIEPMVMGGLTSTSILFKGDELPVSPTMSQAPSRFTTMGPMVYAVSSAGLTVSEMSDKFNGFVRILPIPGGKANGIAHLDQKLYIAAGEAGLRYVDVNEPGNPVEVGFFDFEGDLGSANNVWVERISQTKKLVILADGQSGLRLIEEERFLNSSNINITIHAKSKADLGENGKLAVFVNGVQVGSAIDVSSINFETYNVQMAAPLAFGDEVKVQFFNDNGPRNVSISYVKIGEDYFYPWINNYYSMLNSLIFSNDTDNLVMEQGGYYKFIF